jgi:hypothetical protein
VNETRNRFDYDVAILGGGTFGGVLDVANALVSELQQHDVVCHGADSFLGLETNAG